MIVCIVLYLEISVNLCLWCIFVVISLSFELIFSVRAKRLAEKSLSKITYFVSCVMLPHNQ